MSYIYRVLALELDAAEFVPQLALELFESHGRVLEANFGNLDDGVEYRCREVILLTSVVVRRVRVLALDEAGR